jgi:uncharacterized protein (DUF427 family)
MTMEMWRYRGQKRPPFADEPAEGQESVWDYPRPPRVETTGRLVEVRAGKRLIASTRGALRVLETASPPGYYIPPEDIDLETLVRARGSSVCEWKGEAAYWALAGDEKGVPVGWSYPDPRADFRELKDYVSFYPGRIECYVEEERVRPQPGRFYGGWITGEIAGPVKGGPGTDHW